MKINSTSKSNNSVSTSQSFKGIAPNPIIIPEFLGDAGRYIGNNIGTPEKKLIIATTAVLLRPLIDLKCAEEDKKVDTAIKSASKAIAGGLTGVTIRALFIKLTNKLIKFRGGVVKDVMSSKILDADELKHLRINKQLYKNLMSKLLLPKALEEMKDLEGPVKAAHILKKYNNSLGELLAVLTMALFTNSALDAPLTSDFQDIFTGIIKENKPIIKAISDVAKNRYNIIANWGTEKQNNIKRFFNKSKQIFNIIVGKTE